MSSRQTTAWVLPLTLLSFVLAASTGYRNSLGEPDLVRMVMAVVYGNATNVHMAAGFHYGSAFSFAYYELLYALIPAQAMGNPDQVALYLNYCGLAFSALFASGLCLMLGRLLRPHVAIFVAIAFLFSPLTMPLLASAHPFIAAAALLFWACWLLLLAVEHQGWQGISFIALAAMLLLCALCLRSDVVLGFPFLIAVYWSTGQRRDAKHWGKTAAVTIILTCVFAAFLHLQRQYVVAEGGAGSSLLSFLQQFFSPDRAARGVIVLALSLGLVSLLLLVSIFWRAHQVRRDVLLVLLALALPGLLFWLPNPQPSRHFALPVLALDALIGLLYADHFKTFKRAVLLGIVLVLANQIAAELARPLIIAKYQWPYATEGRRATQQVPLGGYLLDQSANHKMQEKFRAEAVKLAMGAPQDLIVLADGQSYLIAWQLAFDPTLRLSQSQIGGFQALLLGNAKRHIYFIDKNNYWPKDVLAELLPALPENLRQTPIYVQPITVSRYDHSTVPPERLYAPDQHAVVN